MSSSARRLCTRVAVGVPAILRNGNLVRSHHHVPRAVGCGDFVTKPQLRRISSSRVLGKESKEGSEANTGKGQSFIEKASVAGINAILGKFVHRPGKFDSSISGLSVVSVSSGKVTCTMTVEEKVQNAFNTLHGGAAATLVDIVGTIALMTLDPTRPGVSVDLNVSYMKAAKAGSELLIEGRVLKTGKSLGFTEIEIKNKEDGSIVAIGRHTKFLG